MNLNLDIKDLKEQIHGMLGKLSKSPNTIPNNSTTAGSHISSDALRKMTNPLTHQLAKYSFEHEILIGIDITPHYLRICQMTNSYGQWLLNNLASSCIESQFRKYDIQSNPDLYVENLKDLVNKNNIKIKNAAFSLPTSSSIIKVLNVPDMSEEDFAQAAALGSIWESMITLDGSISEYSVFYTILSHNPPKPTPVVELPAPVIEVITTETIEQAPVEMMSVIEPAITDIISVPENIEPTIDMQPEMAFDIPMPEPEPITPGPTMDVLFVATKLADIYLYSDIIRRAGLNPVIADVRCLALKHAFESNPDNMKDIATPYAFIEFGPDENYIFVVDGMHTDIYNVFVSEDDRNIVIYHSEDIAQMKSFVQNFASQVLQILQQHESQYQTGSINNIFVTSSAPLHVSDASSAPLVKTFVEDISAFLGSYKVTECNFCGHIVVPDKFAKQVNAEGNLSAWAPSIGIASRKLDIFDYEQDIPSLDKINLLLEGEETKKSMRTSIISTIAFAMILVISMAITGSSYLSLNNTKKSLSEQIKQMGKIEGEYNTKVSEAQKLTLVMNQVTSLDTIKNSLPSNQSSILAAYRHITNVIPEGIWLNEITYTLPNKIELSGNATDDESILAFVEQLNQGNEFEKMSLKTMQTKEETAKEKDKAAAPAIQTSDSLIKNFVLEGFVKKSNTGLEILSKEAKNGN